MNYDYVKLDLIWFSLRRNFNWLCFKLELYDVEFDDMCVACYET